MGKLAKLILIFIIFVENLQFFSVDCKKAVALTNKENYESMALIEAKSGRVLYSKDKDKKLPMASTTKILTSIVAIENCDDLDKKHFIPKQAVGIEGSSIYLKENEELSVRELLYGLMLRSGNDSAVAIAILISGSVDAFVELMNNYCEKLNLKNTHIVTVNGLHDDAHYSSAYDLAQITAYAMKNEVFKDLVSTKEIKINNTLGKNEKYRFLKNKNKLLKMIDGADGVKTGYTKKAGKCFVGSATRNDMQVICVVLNSRSMFDECAEIIEKAFNEYKMVRLLRLGELAKMDVEIQEKTQIIPVLIKKDIFYPLSAKELSKLTAKVELSNENINLLDDTSDGYYCIGTIDFRVENNLIFSEKIYTIVVGRKSSVKDNFYKIVRAF